MKLRQHSTRCTLCSDVKERSTDLERIFLFYKSVARIFLAASLPTPRQSASGLMVIYLSCITVARVFSTFSLDRAETSWPGRGSSSSDSLHSSDRPEHRKTCARLGHHRTHFSGLGTLPCQSYPIYSKIWWRHVAPCRNSWHTKQTHAYFDGDRTTTDAVQMSVCFAYLFSGRLGGGISFII
jgi:hypothetical protein